MTEAKRDPLDIILSMGRVSTEGPFYRIELQIRGGDENGKVVQLIAPTYELGGGKYLIVERKPDPDTGEIVGMPILAMIPPDRMNTRSEGLAQSLRSKRKQAGTKRTGLGHVR